MLFYLGKNYKEVWVTSKSDNQLRALWDLDLIFIRPRFSSVGREIKNPTLHIAWQLF